MRRTGVFLAGFAALFSSCTEEFAVPDETAGGEVVISLSRDGSTSAVPGSRSGVTQAASDAELPDLADFEVEIYNSSGIRLYRDTYAETEGLRIPLNAGEYRLLAQHGDSLGIGFNSVWYAADTVFTVHGQTVEELSAVARMSKVKVAVEYGTNLQLRYSQYHSRVRLDGSASRYLKFEKNEVRAGYMPAGSLGYEFYAMVDGEWMYYPAEPVECRPNDFITFHAEIDTGTGDLTLVTVRVDDSMNVIEKQETIPADAAPKDPPAIALTGFDGNNGYSFIEADGAPLVQADVVAKGGIKSCVLGISSEYLAGLGVPESVDLAAEISPEIAEALRSVGMRWPRDIAGARFANLDFTASSRAVKYDRDASSNFAGTFTLTVTDELDRTASETFSVACREPGALDFSPDEDNAFARRFRGFSAGISEGNPEAISIQYSTDGVDWTAVGPASVSEGTASYADITGLVPGTAYQVRAIYNGNEDYATEPVVLTTETAAQVGNPGFEDNYSVRMYHQSVLWASNSIYRYYFWKSDSEDRWWDTVNDLTTPDPGSSSVWDYRSASGTVPTSDESNTASYHLRTYDGQSSLVTEGHTGTAAEIATVGWGAGNTWTAAGTDPSSRTPGEMFIGTYGSPVDYGKPFPSRPTAVTFWYKYYSYNNEATSPYVEIYADDGSRIGYGSFRIDSTVVNFAKARMDIEYSSLAKGSEITIVFKSTDSSSPATKAVWGDSGALSGYLDSRHIGSILTVDDIELIYE